MISLAEITSYVGEVVDAYSAELSWSDETSEEIRARVINAMMAFPMRAFPGPDERGTRVYLIMDRDGHVKVGVSDDPAWRVRALAAGNARGLKVIHQTQPFTRDFAIAIEGAVHKFLTPHAMGREWFSCDWEDALRAIHLHGALLR